MHEYLIVGAEHCGLLVWLLWALIGVFAAMVAARMTQGRRILWFDIIIGLVASTLGGYLSTQFLGDTPLMLFLISVMSAAFCSAAVLWITGALTAHFTRDEHLD